MTGSAATEACTRDAVQSLWNVGLALVRRIIPEVPRILNTARALPVFLILGSSMDVAPARSARS